MAQKKFGYILNQDYYTESIAKQLLVCHLIYIVKQ